MRFKAAQIITVVALTFLTLGVNAPHSQAAENGALRFHTYGPNGNAFCNGDGIVSGHLTDFGTAIINEANGKVSATVHIQNGRPNTLYVIRLIQNLRDCYTVDKVVRTNESGIATVHFSEPARGRADSALLAIDKGVLFGHPNFVTETYHY